MSILCQDLYTWFTPLCAAPPATWRPCSGTAATWTRPTGPCWTQSLSTRGCSGLCDDHNELDRDPTCSDLASASASGLTSSVWTPRRWASCLGSPASTESACTASRLSRGWRVRQTRVTASAPRLWSDLSYLTPHPPALTSGPWQPRDGTKLDEWMLKKIFRYWVDICQQRCLVSNFAPHTAGEDRVPQHQHQAEGPGQAGHRGEVQC